MSGFVLKMIAILTMTLDHSGYVIFKNFSFFNYIGRLAFPIFAFGISEGYLHTKNLKKYFLRLGIFAVVSQIPYYLFFSQITSPVHLNVLFTLLLGLLAITIYDKVDYQWISLPCVAMITYFSFLIHTEYSWYGILLMLLFHQLKDHKLACTISSIILMTIYAFLQYWMNGFGYQSVFLWLCMVSSLLFINLYNGKKGKDSKYILYLFYPLHLTVLYVIFSLLH